MKKFTALILTAILGGCGSSSRSRTEVFEAAPSSIGQGMETATIEDYILALPPFEFHEESVEQFAERVRNSRSSEKANFGKDQEFLFVRGDGSAPSKEFVLDRELRRLTIMSLNWEPGAADDIVTMRRVPGGWMRGHYVDCHSSRRARCDGSQ